MKLNIAQRLTILNLLPEQGDITALRILRELKEKVGLNEEERASSKFRIEGTQAQWDSDVVADIEFSDVQKGMIRAELNLLNSSKTLSLSQVPLYEAFCENHEAALAEALGLLPGTESDDIELDPE